MARPKTLKKPSKRRLERSSRRKSRRRSVSFISGGVGWTSGGAEVIDYPSPAAGDFMPLSTSVTAINSASSVSGMIVTASGGTGTVPARIGRHVTIESLDHGLTWHTTDTLESAVNIDGQLVLGLAPCGQAPDHMRPWSGVYSFQIPWRMATEEETETWCREQEERETSLARQWAEEAPKAEKARDRARELLLSHLTPTQRHDFETRNGFWQISQFGNKYWVTKSTAVRFDDRGCAIQRYCIHAVDSKIPAEDNALIRKLLLECNEEHFLRTANPGMPSEFDVVSRGPAMIDARTGVMRRNPPRRPMRTNNDYVQIIPVPVGYAPLLLNVNGVVRPICG